MKYILIFAAIVFLVRIDFILNFFDKQADKFQNPQPTEMKPREVESMTNIVPVESDLAIKTSPRKAFIAMLESFKIAPDENIRVRAIDHLRAHPTMFTDKLDRELESAIYGWRDHLLQRNKETHTFMLEMMKSFKGENLEMMKRFLSFAIDADMMDFLSFYSKSTDANCMLMSYLGDPLPDVERFNELSERLVVLEGVLSNEKLPADLKAYGQKCQIVLRLNIDKIKATLPPLEDPENPTYPESSAPAPAEAPAPEPTGTTP